ncbi:MAG: hypothetical protein WC747_04780 [Candidatus Babeliales bacterium]|jgi:hypothetical protein
MVKVQKNSMVLAAVVCFVGQAQAMNLDTAKGLAATSVALCAVDSVRDIVKARSVKLSNLPFGIQNEVRPTEVAEINLNVPTCAFNEQTGHIDKKTISVPTVDVAASKNFLGLRVGHVKAGVHFPINGSALSKILATEAHVEGVNVETVLKVGAAYLAYTQLLPKVVAKVTGK